MKITNNILFATDFSKNSENALPFAIDLVRKKKGKLYLLHTNELQIITPEDVLKINTGLDTIDTVIRDIRLSGENDLKQLIKDFKISKIEHKALFRDGDVKNEILDEIKKNDIELIVMGTKGATAENGLLMSSITKSVIQNASCPVFAIPETAKFKNISKIVYLSNLNYDETNIINYLVDFAKLYNAEVVILHIDSNDDAITFISTEVNILEIWSVDLLKDIIKKVDYPKISIKEMITEDTIEGINEYIKENKTDVIAMTTYTTSLINKLFHKSLTKQVLLHTQIPLLAFNGNKYSEL